MLTASTLKTSTRRRKNWLDGEPIASAEQADKVSLLLDMIRKAEKAADESRVKENEPFDLGKAEVQARYARSSATRRP